MTMRRSRARTRRGLLRAIRRAAAEKWKTLDLLGNGIAELPGEIGQLAQLQSLRLDDNQMKSLPESIGQLTNLRTLDVANNQLTALPESIGQLTNLQTLNILRNHLTSLPEGLGQLVNLTLLDLSWNELSDVPESIGELTRLNEMGLAGVGLTSIPNWAQSLKSLTIFWLEENDLESIPDWIGQLTNLQTLNLRKNQLKSLPESIGHLTNLQMLTLSSNQLKSLPNSLAQLEKLESLQLNDNPLTEPPPEVVRQGTDAIQAYLRERAEGEERQWVSKLLLVGEGGVGKTQLLRVLRGEEFVESAPSTRGIEISDDVTEVGPIELEHPMDAGITMRLNSWDFGGQEVYHATHQFFLTQQSLYLLAWNARYGWEQGKLYYWLDTIQAMGPDCPVLIVATHIDERPAQIPLQDLQRRYPQVVGHWEVSSKTKQGIGGLREAIREEGAKLPLMGEPWPTVCGRRWPRTGLVARTPGTWLGGCTTWGSSSSTTRTRT